MKLYHGTRADFKTSILKNGIEPRFDNPGNWNNCPSKEHLTYLTRAYALYFAAIATGKDNCPDGTPALIVEVDTERLDPDNLCPDEDYIAQAIMHNRQAGRLTGDKDLDAAPDLLALTNLIEPLAWSEYWRMSVDDLGQCACYGEIPPDAITRYALIDTEKAGRIIADSMEPTITVQNFRYCGGYYIALTEFVFGDRDDPPVNRTDHLTFEGVDVAELEKAQLSVLPEDQRKFWIDARFEKADRFLKARQEGVSVHTVNP